MKNRIARSRIMRCNPFIIGHSAFRNNKYSQLLYSFPSCCFPESRRVCNLQDVPCLSKHKCKPCRNSFLLSRSRNSIELLDPIMCLYNYNTKAIYNFSILVNSHVYNFLIAISSWYLQIIAKWFSVIPHENLYNIEDVKDILSCGKCYPECNAVNYNAKISIADLESNQHVAELLWVFIYSLFTVTSTFTNELYWYVRRDNVDIKNQSVLTIYFRKYGTIRLRQDVIYRWYELMGKNILSFRNTRK